MEHCKPLTDDERMQALRNEIEAARLKEPKPDDSKLQSEIKSFAEEKAKEILNFFEPTRANEVAISIRECLIGYFRNKYETRAEELEYSKRLLEQFDNNKS